MAGAYRGLDYYGIDELYTEEATARGVFGAPSYVVGDEIFWGQDRLDFLDRRLAQ